MIEMLMELVDMQRLMMEMMPKHSRILVAVNIDVLPLVRLQIPFGGDISMSYGVYECQICNPSTRGKRI
jgi:hypothetical protein